MAIEAFCGPFEAIRPPQLNAKSLAESTDALLLLKRVLNDAIGAVGEHQWSCGPRPREIVEGLEQRHRGRHVQFIAAVPALAKPLQDRRQRDALFHQQDEVASVPISIRMSPLMRGSSFSLPSSNPSAPR